MQREMDKCPEQEVVLHNLMRPSRKRRVAQLAKNSDVMRKQMLMFSYLAAALKHIIINSSKCYS